MSTRLKAQQGQPRPLWSHRRYSFVIKLAVKSLNATVLVPLLVKQTNANYYKKRYDGLQDSASPNSSSLASSFATYEHSSQCLEIFINMLSAFNT